MSFYGPLIWNSKKQWRTDSTAATASERSVKALALSEGFLANSLIHSIRLRTTDDKSDLSYESPIIGNIYIYILFFFVYKYNRPI